MDEDVDLLSQKFSCISLQSKVEPKTKTQSLCLN